MQTKALSLKKIRTLLLKDVLSISLFVFLLSISAKVRVYFPYSPVPVTFQTLVVFLSVSFL